MMQDKKKNSLYVAAFASILLVALFVYSCTTDEYADNPRTERNGVAQSRAFSSMKNNGNTLIDSIAASDEFWEFKMCSQLLAEKFNAYTSTLSEKEYDELMSNLNVDEYMEAVIKKANLEKELQQMDDANKNLSERTGFLRLSEDEQSQLFMMYAESNELAKPTFLKTRKEGGDTNKCEKLKQAAYAQAEVDYDKAVTKCKSASSSQICYTLASAKYIRNKEIADIEYSKCLQNNK